jgi:gallate dioxygenase
MAEDPEALTRYTHEELIKLGGTESVEVVNWLAMRGALPASARQIVGAYYAHRIMGYGLAAYDVSGAA